MLLPAAWLADQRRQQQQADRAANAVGDLGAAVAPSTTPSRPRPWRPSTTRGRGLTTLAHDRLWFGGLAGALARRSSGARKIVRAVAWMRRVVDRSPAGRRDPSAGRAPLPDGLEPSGARGNLQLPVVLPRASDYITSFIALPTPPTWATHCVLRRNTDDNTCTGSANGHLSPRDLISSLLERERGKLARDIPEPAAGIRSPGNRRSL